MSIMNHDLRSRFHPGIKLGMKSTFIMAKTVLIRNEISIYRDLSILNWISYIKTNWIRSGLELNLDLCEVHKRPARNQSSSLQSYYSCLLPRFSGLFMSRQKGVHESPRTVAMHEWYLREVFFKWLYHIFFLFGTQKLSKILYQQTILRNIRTTTVHNKSNSDKE